MAVLKPSVNVFALLADDDTEDTALVAKATAAARPPMNINRKQQPEPSVWKAKAIAANAAKKTKKKPPPASKARPNTASTKKPQQPAAPRQAYYNASTASNAAASKQQAPAPLSLAGQLFGGAYPSARYLIHLNRKPQQDGTESDAKDGVASGSAPADDKKQAGQNGDDKKQGAQNGPRQQKGGQDRLRQQKGGYGGPRQKGSRANEAAVNSTPAPAKKEEPAAPVKPAVPPPPPPSFEDFNQFPSLK